MGVIETLQDRMSELTVEEILSLQAELNDIAATFTPTWLIPTMTPLWLAGSFNAIHDGNHPIIGHLSGGEAMWIFHWTKPIEEEIIEEETIEEGEGE